MKYAVNVAFEVAVPLSGSDPDVRSVSRLPGFIKLEETDRDGRRLELSLELEAGSVRDAMDHAESLLIEYTDSLHAYRPRLLESVTPRLQ